MGEIREEDLGGKQGGGGEKYRTRGVQIIFVPQLYIARIQRLF